MLIQLKRRWRHQTFLKADGSIDVNNYLTSYTETNDLTSAVTWANVPNANITQAV